MKTAFIYVLKEPDTGEIRYVGKADNVKKRLGTHVRHARNEKNYRACWIRSLLKVGKRPVIETIDECSPEDWPSLEAAYIQFFIECGNSLTNSTLGGEGPVGYKHTEEAKEKVSRLHSGRVLSEDHKNKIRVSMMGKKNSLGIRCSQETLAKKSVIFSGEKNPMFGRKHSDETKAKIKASWVKRKARRPLVEVPLDRLRDWMDEDADVQIVFPFYYEREKTDPIK